jgi:hypothetical protein
MHTILSAAFLAAAAPVFATPLETTVVESSVKTTEANFRAVSVRDNFCHGGQADIPIADESSYEVGVIVAVAGDVNCFGSKFNKRMNTPAHITYEKALYLYQDIHHMVIHTLTKSGAARMKRLIEIAAKIQRAFEYLDEAASMNKHDTHHIRRKWIRHEIRHLRHKLNHARWFALHLPNLALCQEAFHFVVDVSLKVVKFVAAIPLVIGAAVGAAIHWAVHAVVDAFHFIGHVLKWTIRGIIGAFIKFHRKVKRGLHKLGKKLKKIGHHIKEDLKDIGSIIVDIGHHIFHRHHCEKGDFGVVIVGVEAEKECQYEQDDLCIIGEKQCTREEFSMKAQMHYDIEFSWTQEESITRVTECMRRVNDGFLSMKSELEQHEVKVVQANWEAAEGAEEGNDEDFEEADE